MSLLAQGVEQLEKIEEVVDTQAVTGWDIATAAILIIASWPLGRLLAKIVQRLLDRVPSGSVEP